MPVWPYDYIEDTLSGYEIYYAGRMTWDRNGRRAIVGTTWAAQPWSGPGGPDAGIGILSGFIGNFGPANSWFRYNGWGSFVERLWPTRHRYAAAPLQQSAVSRPLNTSAPEAAFRLQRVGGGTTPRIGRITSPIWDDGYFTDLPHRRRIVPQDTSFFDVTPFGDPHILRDLGVNRYFLHVICDRRINRWQRVTSMRMLPSTVRVWQRNRVYVPGGEPTPDWQFVPPMLTYDVL